MCIELVERSGGVLFPFRGRLVARSGALPHWFCNPIQVRMGFLLLFSVRNLNWRFYGAGESGWGFSGGCDEAGWFVCFV